MILLFACFLTDSMKPHFNYGPSWKIIDELDILHTENLGILFSYAILDIISWVHVNSTSFSVASVIIQRLLL